MRVNIINTKQGIIDNQWFSHITTHTEKKMMQRTKDNIRRFNRGYDNTEIDTCAFDKMMSTSQITDFIYTKIFQSYLFQSEAIIDFKSRVSRLAIESVNQYYKTYNRKIIDETVFYDYFHDLIDSQISCRNNMMSIRECALISIINEKIEKSKSEVMELNGLIS